MLRFPDRISQNRIHLLQRGQENFPQLVQNLGFSGRTCLIQLQCHPAKLLLKLNILQKCCNGKHLTAQVPSLPKAVLHTL